MNRSQPSLVASLSRGAAIHVLALAVVVTALLSLAGTAYAVAPTITGIAPSAGGAAGGTAVSISGSGFIGTTAVRFGTTTATFTVNSDVSISATSPARAPGAVEVTVTNADGTSGPSANSTFTYYPQPVVTSVNPASGSAGTNVSITGSGFTGATSVLFGSTPTAFNVLSDTQAMAVAPAGSGVVNVRVANPGATSPASATFSYSGSAMPVVSSISPTGGPTSGGTSVTITGSGFTGASSVTFGGVAAVFSLSSDGQIVATSPARAAGVVDILVTTPAGTSTNTTADNFTYGGPAVFSVTPNSGPTSGGTSVTITGSGFTGTTSVTWGGDAGPFTVISDSQIAAISPVHAAGLVDILVTTPAGTSANTAADNFTYGGPVVTAINPTSGPNTGGTVVTITGSGFTGATAVTFGGVGASFTVSSNTQIVATSPAHVAGLVDVLVTAPGGTSANTAADNFTYGGPVVTAINPTSGPTSGGTVVTITGSGFTGTTSVTFGGVGASFTVSSNTQIVATSPAHAAGLVDILVTGPGGTSANTAADNFTYGGPVVTSINPTSGPTTGGTVVTITGSGFTGATAVTFGGVGASFTVSSNTQIVATSPAHVAGLVDILVTAPGGTSANTAADNFTYGGPVVTSVTPIGGPTSGGTTVTITGSGFTGTTSVTFGGVAASFTLTSNSQIIATSPARAAGLVDILVTAPGGTSANTAADNFTYGPPVVTAISPNSGPGAGGTNVTITGSGFLGTTDVLFGSVSAASFTVVNNTTITAVSPSGLSGSVQVRVVGPGGTSAIVTAGTFTISDETIVYTLYFRWSLISWEGVDGASIATVLASGGTGVAGQVTAVFRWNGPGQEWEAYFPAGAGIPGANDFSTFSAHRSYWIAIRGPGSVTWTVTAGD